ncbi:MAG: type 1 glutamine amidotransferase, partial [Candidatus Eremiobacteraeota bacterium]|nr:type 1 glutamine amidotransferase [Candidatus Eremiobacteraeota bacterium]
MAELGHLKVAALVTDGVEEAELTEPVKALREAGADVELIGLDENPVQALRHIDKASRIPVDRSIDGLDVGDYDALLLPGGAVNADRMRADDRVTGAIRQHDAKGKPIAAICHAPWELISAGVVEGRKITSYHTIQDDVRNAGGHWVDEACVVDGNWVTSRKPDDIPVFNERMLELFGK